MNENMKLRIAVIISVIIVFTLCYLSMPSEFDKELKYYGSLVSAHDKPGFGYSIYDKQTFEEYKALWSDDILTVIEVTTEELRYQATRNMDALEDCTIFVDRKDKVLWITGEPPTKESNQWQVYIYFFKAQ